MTLRIRRRGADAFIDRVASFASTVKVGGERTARILRPAPDLPRDPESIEEALGLLKTQHEELVVAEGLLRTQLAELTRMGRALDAQRERCSDLFDHAADAFVVTDRFTVVHDANAVLSELLAVEERFLRGRPIAAFLHPSDVRRTHELLGALERGEKRVIELSLRPRAGGEVRVVAHLSLASRGEWILWSFRPSLEPKGTAPRTNGGPDLARALRDKDELLTRERHTREELERASRAKDRFIAVLSHDLRGPLNAVLGWTQLLRREPLDQSARSRAFETIERNAHTQARLIDELLDISRISAGRVQLALTAVDVAVSARRCVEGALPKAAELGLDLTFTGDVPLTLIVDRERLEQILSNLLSNAMKYTPRGGRIGVDARRDGGYARITVRDTGKGIEGELLPHIFELYTQERSYSAARAGLGLGLYIVKQLVELQGGTVSVESAGVGSGAAFTVLLPLHDEVVAKPSEILLEPPINLRGLRVLVVDDEEDARDLMSAILRRRGAEVACAGGGDEALSLLDAFAADVVISDLAMPGGDGCELIAQLRKRNPSVAALAVSGFAATRDAERALAAGFDVHIGKPVSAAELIEAVQEASRLRHH